MVWARRHHLYQTSMRVRNQHDPSQKLLRRRSPEVLLTSGLCCWKLRKPSTTNAMKKKPKMKKESFMICEAFLVAPATHNRTRKSAQEVLVCLFRNRRTTDFRFQKDFPNRVTVKLFHNITPCFKLRYWLLMRTDYPAVAQFVEQISVVLCHYWTW